jgi:hypothetical protein
MTANLRHVLAGIGVRSLHETEEYFIDPLASIIHHKAIVYPM